jgi:hypothetical protein
MNKRANPSSAAMRVLRAFPFPREGAAISLRHVEAIFRRAGVRHSSEVFEGLNYALKVGWISSGGLSTFVLSGSGVEALDETPSSPTSPVSTWHTWAHG